MHKPFKSYSVQWMVGDKALADPLVNARYMTDDLYWVQHPIPTQVGHGVFTSIHLSNGVSLHQSRLHFQATHAWVEPLRAVVHMDMKEPSLLVTSVQTGGITRYDYLEPTEHSVAPDRTLVQWKEHSHAALKFDASPIVEALYFRASKSSLEQLMGPELAEQLRIYTEQSEQLHALPRSVTAPLAYCFDYRLRRPLHKLRAQTKTLEFLEGLVRFFETKGRTQPVKKESRASTTLELIQQQTANFPSVTELASRLGLSAKTLNQSFIKAYGMSVAQFVREHRLTLAHEMLVDTRHSVGEIASKLGFSQLSHFSASFKAFFGYSPSALRASIVDVDQVREG